MSGYLGLLEEEKVLVLDDLAVAEKISLSYVSRIFRLANQSTKIVQAILEGKTAGMV
jgi:DNA-binding IscR family transcriptional regulator